MSSSEKTSLWIEDNTSLKLIPTAMGSTPIALHTRRMIAKDVEISNASGPVTNWRAIYTISAINLMSFVLMYALNVSAFVYLLQIDSSSTIGAQAAAKSSYRFIIGFACAISSVYAYTKKVFRHSIIAGTAMQTFGCFLYAFIEIFPECWRTYIWLLIFGLHAAAKGANTVLVSYVPRVSSNKDRIKAYSFLSGAEVLAVVIGPVIQFACHLVPGVTEILGVRWLKISEYTVPIWLCCCLSIFNLICVVFVMEEPPVESNAKILRKTLAQAWDEIKNTDSVLVSICILEKCIAAFGCTTILTLAPPLIVKTFNIDESGQSLYTTLFQCVSGICALVTACLCAKALNSKQHCNLIEYGWCSEAWIVNPWVWIVTSGSLIGMAFPLANIAHDTIYSQILGGIDQNVFTGLMVMIQNICMIPVPLLATSVFKHHGPSVWWLIVECAMGAGLVLWLCSMPRLRKWTEEVNKRDVKNSESERLNRKELITEKEQVAEIPFDNFNEESINFLEVIQRNESNPILNQ